MTDGIASSAAPARRRPTLGRRALIGTITAVAAATAAFFLVRPWLPPGWSTAGSPELYVMGLLGTALVMIPFAFSLAKRSGRSASPPAWFVAHVLASSVGVGLLLVHSGGNFDGPPALMLAAGLVLVLQGAWARLVLPWRISETFAEKHRSFGARPTVDRAALARLIDAKRALLADLDPAASEALFSPTLAHWLRRPVLAWRYASLARAEMRLIGQRAAVPAAQAWWRRTHIALAFLFLLGVLVHVVTVTFFAGYVADGRPIHWWHIADWGK